MTEERAGILVLDGDQAAALAVLRSLARAGYRVDVAAPCADPLAAHSRHAARSLRYPDPRLEPDAFVTWLKDLVTRERYELVIPITDDSLQPMAIRRAELDPLTRIAVAPEPGLETFTDKAKTMALARSLEVPVPEGHLVSSMAEVEALIAAKTLGHPVVVKPVRSVTAEESGSRAALSVRYALDDDELRLRAQEALKHGALLLQSFAGGEGHGVEVLCDQGEIIYAFQHRRLHEWPLTGGGSSYRESVALVPELLEDARKLVRAAAYHGVAMVEFKYDPESRSRALMEVNARFWGSLPLCTAAGADFPLYLRDLLVEKKRPARRDYRVGIRCRKFSRDLFWSIEVLRKTDPNPLIRWPARHLGLTSWFGVLHPRHRFDVQTFADLKPGLVDLRRSFALLFERFFARRRRRAALKRMAALRGRREPLLRRLESARKIVLVCYGNINRSALAAADLSRRLPGVEVLGRGFHEKEGRALDENMLRALGTATLGLEEHSSCRLRSDDLKDADLVFAMDGHQLLRLEGEHPELRDRIYLYGVLDDEVSVEIADPYGGDDTAYAAARDRILRIGGRIAEQRSS